ncbi:glycoside hydrolase family 15 protein [Leifsonia poae]|uniref:glycoside hydrolase family 15 protein n=1 Tax=Leifsonia poae TaxID=110933 RepID=UPI003D6673D3
MARIEDYAMIGDLKTAALVSVEGSIDWLCLPHFDSPACFAALLGTEEAGSWRLRPLDESAASRHRYRPGTLIVDTIWETPDAQVTVTDFMPVQGVAGDEVTLVRIVEGVRGSLRMRSDIALRFDYGRVVPWVTRDDLGIRAVAGPDAAYLRSSTAMHGEDLHTVSEFTVEAGERVSFALTWNASHLPPPEPVAPVDSLAETDRYWTDWSSRSAGIGGRYAEPIQRSLITLKALTFLPTGGIVAAATTSLPEQLGGPRNWDYRYCWLRDATMSLRALLSAGYTEEPEAWRDWLLRAIAGDPAELQIMYGLDGSRRLPEAELPWLPGYENSAPVRIGNEAADQLQLDAWGEILRGLSVRQKSRMRAMRGKADVAWELQRALVGHLRDTWTQPDNGLWEVRGPRRHFTYSKVMAWVAADGMVKEAEEFDLPGPVEEWAELRDAIHADVLANGYDSERNAFVQHYGGTALDASLLQLGSLGFLPPDDDRLAGTVDAIQRDLMWDGFVLRYRPEEGDDGMPGGEGVFLACSFWMVDALVGIGRHDEAEALFEKLLAVRSSAGLLSEEWDPSAKRQLGNTPQAFSHFALINTALLLARDE